MPRRRRLQEPVVREDASREDLVKRGLRLERSVRKADVRIAVVKRGSSRATPIRDTLYDGDGMERRRWDGGLVSASTEQDKNGRGSTTVQ